MKKINKNNLFMYALIVIAVLMLSTTLTMAVLSDNKKGKEDLVFGRVAISGENSCLELDIDDTITTGSEILNDSRFLYFSPTDDTENMIVRFKIEYQTDAENKDDEIALLNSTILTDYFETASETGDSGYKYIYEEGYFYLVKYSEDSVSLENMRVITSQESNVSFIISDNYIFNGLNKDEQATLFSGIAGINIKLVVTVEASQVEGLESLSDVWEMPTGEMVNIGIYNQDRDDFEYFTSVRADASGNITLPTRVPSSYSGEELCCFNDAYSPFAPGSTININDLEPIDDEYVLDVEFAGMYGEIQSISGDPVNSISSEQWYTWSEIMERGIFTLTNGVLSAGTGEYYVYASSLEMPNTITTISSSAFNQYDENNNPIVELSDAVLVLPGSLVTIEDIDDDFFNSVQVIIMFDNVQSIGNFQCYNARGIYYEDGITYIGSGNNPYLFASNCDDYNANYDENNPNSTGYNYPDGYNINTDTKFIFVNVLVNYIHVNTAYKTANLTPTDLSVAMPTNYNYVGMKYLTEVYRDFTDFTQNAPYMTAPFITHQDGIMYLKKGNNNYDTILFAYGIESGSTVTLNSNVRNIIPGAFSYLYMFNETPETPTMFSLVLNEGLTRIEDGAFYGATITSVTLPNTLTYIGNEAFNGCKALTSVTIPATVSHIGYYSFANTAITSFTVANGNTHYTTYGDGKYLVKTSGHVLIQYAVGSTDTEITIPSDIYSLAVGSFVGNATLLQVTIPSTVTSVAYQNEDNSTFIYHSQNNGDPITAYIFELSTVSTNEPETKIIIDSQSFYNAYVTAKGNSLFDLSSGEDVNYFYIYINTQFDDNATSTDIFNNGDGGYKPGKSDASYNCYRFFSPGA